jgi:transglutaminase-like putative cysteine protease
VSWRIEIRHVTGYRYAGEVVASYNEARLTPLSTLHQTTIGARIDVDPPCRQYRYWDYWGSLVHAFDVHVPHRELVVAASSVVETPAAHTTADPDAVGWQAIDDPAVHERFYEPLSPSRFVAWDAELADVASDLRARSATPHDAVSTTAAWVGENMVYEKGRTDVSTSAVDAWRAGRGVCQDFVHLTLALLRAMGVPARYVSGYLHPDPEAAIGQTVVGESHAWAEAWLGEWHSVDPTNAGVVGQRHVLVGRGRDYSDLSPLKGIYSGAPAAKPTVTVEVTRRA